MRTLAHLDNRCIVVFSDRSKNHIELEQYIEMHISELSSNELTEKTIQWVHIAVSNSKRWLLDIHYKIMGQYLQNYLNEFYYKLNRRYFDDKLFDRALIAIVGA